MSSQKENKNSNDYSFVPVGVGDKHAFNRLREVESSCYSSNDVDNDGLRRARTCLERNMAICPPTGVENFGRRQSLQDKVALDNSLRPSQQSAPGQSVCGIEGNCPEPYVQYRDLKNCDRQLNPHVGPPTQVPYNGNGGSNTATGGSSGMNNPRGNNGTVSGNAGALSRCPSGGYSYNKETNKCCAADIPNKPTLLPDGTYRINTIPGRCRPPACNVDELYYPATYRDNIKKGVREVDLQSRCCNPATKDCREITNPDPLTPAQLNLSNESFRTTTIAAGSEGKHAQTGHTRYTNSQQGRMYGRQRAPGRAMRHGVPAEHLSRYQTLGELKCTL